MMVIYLEIEKFIILDMFLKYVNQIISENDNQPKSCWANTSGNDIVYNYIQNGNETRI